MEETIDQGQEVTPETEQDSTEQSETTIEQEDSNLLDLPDGRRLTGEQVREEYLKLNSEFTKRSQKLSEYEKAAAERDKRAESKAQEVIDKNELLENVDPNVKEAIGKIALDTLQTYIKEQEAERAKEDKDREWNERLSNAEKTHDGKDGLPKFEREKVIDFMMTAEIYDPEIAYREMHMEIIQDRLIKEALRNKGSVSSTESTGGEAPRKPEGNTPKTFEEAAKAAHSRLS
jgi:hypothetical protein